MSSPGSNGDGKKPAHKKQVYMDASVLSRIRARRQVDMDRIAAMGARKKQAYDPTTGEPKKDDHSRSQSPTPPPSFSSGEGSGDGARRGTRQGVVRFSDHVAQTPHAASTSDGYYDDDMQTAIAIGVSLGLSVEEAIAQQQALKTRDFARSSSQRHQAPPRPTHPSYVDEGDLFGFNFGFDPRQYEAYQEMMRAASSEEYSFFEDNVAADTPTHEHQNAGVDGIGSGGGGSAVPPSADGFPQLQTSSRNSGFGVSGGSRSWGGAHNNGRGRGGRGRGPASFGGPPGADGDYIDMSYENLMNLEDVPTPLPEHHKKLIPCYTLTEQDVEMRQKDKGGDCPVCLMAFDVGDEIAMLPACAHEFHKDCIFQWFESRKECCVCRKGFEDMR